MVKIRKLKNIRFANLGVELKQVEKHIKDDGTFFYVFNLYYDGFAVKVCKYTDKNLNNLRKVVSSHIYGCLSTYLKQNL